MRETTELPARRGDHRTGLHPRGGWLYFSSQRARPDHPAAASPTRSPACSGREVGVSSRRRACTVPPSNTIRGRCVGDLFNTAAARREGATDARSHQRSHVGPWACVRESRAGRRARGHRGRRDHRTGTCPPTWRSPRVTPRRPSRWWPARTSWCTCRRWNARCPDPAGSRRCAGWRPPPRGTGSGSSRPSRTAPTRRTRTGSCVTAARGTSWSGPRRSAADCSTGRRAARSRRCCPRRRTPSGGCCTPTTSSASSCTPSPRTAPAWWRSPRTDIVVAGAGAGRVAWRLGPRHPALACDVHFGRKGTARDWGFECGWTSAEVVADLARGVRGRQLAKDGAEDVVDPAADPDGAAAAPPPADATARRSRRSRCRAWRWSCDDRIDPRLPGVQRAPDGRAVPRTADPAVDRRAHGRACGRPAARSARIAGLPGRSRTSGRAGDTRCSVTALYAGVSAASPRPRRRAGPSRR